MEISINRNIYHTDWHCYDFLNVIEYAYLTIISVFKLLETYKSIWSYYSEYEKKIISLSNDKDLSLRQIAAKCDIIDVSRIKTLWLCLLYQIRKNRNVRKIVHHIYFDYYKTPKVVVTKIKIRASEWTNGWPSLNRIDLNVKKKTSKPTVSIKMLEDVKNFLIMNHRRLEKNYLK